MGGARLHPPMLARESRPESALDGRRVHPHDLPGVAVEVVEGAAVHEAVVLGVVAGRAARRDRLYGEPATHCVSFCILMTWQTHAFT